MQHQLPRRRLHLCVICLSDVFIFFYLSGAHGDLHSFPTRRSSDLSDAERFILPASSSKTLSVAIFSTSSAARSEEHTSELQSLTNLVCRLLLEKKNRKQRSRHISTFCANAAHQTRRYNRVGRSIGN